MRQTLLTDCVARSRPLDEYLNPMTNATAPENDDPDELLDDWCDVFGSESEFSERLRFSDHTVESVRTRLRGESAAEPTAEQQPTTTAGSEPISTAEPDSIPSAFRTAERIVDRAVATDRETAGLLLDRHEETAFVHLIAPLAAAASAELDLETELAPSAIESLEDWLFERLTELFQHPLFIQFKAYQRTEYPDRTFSDATDSTELYEEFVSQHRGADYERIFEAYPLLLKLVGVVAEQWRGMVHRLDDRIVADRSELSRTFNDGADLGAVVEIEPLSDDPHGEGEIVLRIEFENCIVVYKPRSVSGEAAFGSILDWTNAHADVPNLYAPTVLERDAYGWMEFVGHRSCDSVAEVERYYERMGGLTALAFVLGSTDLHHDNIVAAGEQPVVIDQETVLSPKIGTSNKPVSPAMDTLLEDSVLNTVLIPFAKESDDEREDLTANGLSDLADAERPEKLPNFHDPNTDAMEMAFDRPHQFDGRNLPRLDGQVRAATEYLDELKRGFRDVSDAILAHREELLDSSGPLAAFEGAEIRYLLRPTSHYASKLSESRYSSRLRSGVRQSLGLESLYTIFVPRDDDGELWKLVETEKETLRRRTIPRFTVPATGRELRDGRGTRLGVSVAESPLDHARRRIADLDDHGIESQLRLVELAFTDSTVSDPLSAPAETGIQSVATADSPQDVVSTVVEQFDEATTSYPDGTLRWAELARASREGKFLVREPPLDLYEGYVGVGVFLAAAAKVREDDALADRSRRVLAAVQSAFESGDPDDLRIGGIAGRGSVAYGLLTAGRLLDEDELVESARTVASRTTEAEIAHDEKLDVMAGSAGELLAQLAVHEETGDETALERARWCGDRLLETTRETGDGYRVPTSDDADRRFGFAHGVGGIGSALMKLASVTGDEEYARVGRDTLKLDAEIWRRETDHTEFATIWGWCNGIAGVGTCRVAMADSISDDNAQEFSVVRENVQRQLSREDSLCCGSAGRALFLLDAGDVFADPSLVTDGEDLFEALLDRAEQEGRLRLANHLPAVPRLGLFTGLTGIGYVALQLEARDAGVTLPNVTRLE